MDLLHFSGKKEISLSNLQDRPFQEKTHYKPRGLWLSHDDTWKQWCLRNYVDCGSIVYEITLHPETNLVNISTFSDLCKFISDFQLKKKEETEENEEAPPQVLIDWQKVAEVYDGIQVKYKKKI